MGITETDLLFKYTGTAGTANPETALGGTISVNTIPSGVANNLFDNVTGDESASGVQHYRGIGLHNSKATHIYMNSKVYITGYTRSGSNYDVVYFAVEKPAGTGGNPDGTIQIIASETSEPTGRTWNAEGIPSSTVYLSGKDYANSVGADDWSAIWMQRSVPAGAAAYSNRAVTLRVEGETSASPYIYMIKQDFKITWGDRDFDIKKVFDEREIIGYTED